jgi:putative transposase
MLVVLEALKVAEVGDRVHSAAETVYQAVLEAELTDLIGAAQHQRSASRI